MIKKYHLENTEPTYLRIWQKINFGKEVLEPGFFEENIEPHEDQYRRDNDNEIIHRDFHTPDCYTDIFERASDGFPLICPYQCGHIFENIDKADTDEYLV